MTWPHARPKPGRLSLGRVYQLKNPDVVTIYRHYPGCWHVEKAGKMLMIRPTHAEAIEFVSAQLARRG